MPQGKRCSAALSTHDLTQVLRYIRPVPVDTQPQGLKHPYFDDRPFCILTKHDVSGPTAAPLMPSAYSTGRCHSQRGLSGSARLPLALQGLLLQPLPGKEETLSGLAEAGQCIQ